MRGLQNTLVSARSGLGRRAVGAEGWGGRKMCRHGNPTQSTEQEVEGRLSDVRMYHLILLLVLPFLPSAVSNISTEEQCQYLDLDKPES